MTQPLGLIAGSGQLPVLLAQKAAGQEVPLFTAGIRGAASPRLEKLSERFTWVSVGQVGALLSFFEKNGVKRAVMHGKVQHSTLFKNPRLDFKAIALLARLKDRSGESILKALAAELAKSGVRLLDGRYLMGDLLAEKGWLTGHDKLDDSLDLGLAKAKKLAGLGIGQSLLMRKKAVVAVEAVEGTDEAIRRAGKLGGAGVVLFKVASPRQDWRFDIPTVGPKTLQQLAKAKAKGLILEAGRVFVLEKEKVIKGAKKSGITILAV